MAFAREFDYHKALPTSVVSAGGCSRRKDAGLQAEGTSRMTEHSGKHSLEFINVVRLGNRPAEAILPEI